MNPLFRELLDIADGKPRQQRLAKQEGLEQCELDLAPGERCRNAATRIVEEPWTPGRFRLRVCEDCAKSQVGMGYHDRGKL